MTGISGDTESTYRAVIDGHQLRVSQRTGAPDTVPLLLLMGVGGSLELWDPLRTWLAEHRGPSTVAVDVPGVGGSPVPRLPLRLHTIARTIVGLLGRLGLARVDVLGLSWGGLLAQELALTAPSRVRRLVLANTNLGAGSIPPAPIPPRRRRPRHARQRNPAGPTFPWRNRGTLYQVVGSASWTSWTRARRVQQPTLVIASSADRLVPIVNARLLTRLLPNARLHVLSDAGHLLLTREPQRVAPTIMEHLLADE